MRAGGCSGDCHSVWGAVAGGLAEGTNVTLKHVGCEGRRQEHGERIAEGRRGERFQGDKDSQGAPSRGPEGVGWRQECGPQ